MTGPWRQPDLDRWRDLTRRLRRLVAGAAPAARRRLGTGIATTRELGSYELVERLAHGGMGEVWRAEHRLLARPVAVKFVRPEMLGAASAQEAGVLLRRFEREAQTTAVLSSPHTIDLFDFGLTREGAFYYVMELLVGRDLDTLVRTFGALPADRVTYLMRQASHSLAEAHARGLVHRDIKPANVYVCRMGLDYDFVKVLDFGLVRFTAPGLGTSLLTLDGTMSGTPAFMAPEVILGGAPIDARADVYALGCLMYWMLTGHRVFEADSPMRMLLQHVEAAPIPPSGRTELPVPPAMDRIVLACLEKDPGRRPADAGALLEMLDVLPQPAWSQPAARRWWESHLAELTGPHVLAVPASPPAGGRAPHAPAAERGVAGFSRAAPAPAAWRP